MTIKPRAQADAHVDQVRDQPFDFSKPFLNTETAAAYVDAVSVNAFRRWAKRQGIASGHMGRRLRFAKADLDQALGLDHRRKASSHV